MTPISAPLLATGSLVQNHGSPRERLADAARQFEAIFLRQVLAEARKSHFGGDMFGEGNPDSALGTFRKMQDEHVADLAATRGAFGLARMIETQLAAQLGLAGTGSTS
ncbi:MAG: rod-binding protein [Novosphingobium sp.]|uniref:rod-binding protein n=1 Tax=Novosphingobium sp. TaxID=1874826 RepID=UPI0032BE388A